MNSYGDRLCPRDLAKHLKKIARELGLKERVKLVSLRHTYFIETILDGLMASHSDLSLIEPSEVFTLIRRFTITNGWYQRSIVPHQFLDRVDAHQLAAVGAKIKEAILAMGQKKIGGSNE